MSDRMKMVLKKILLPYNMGLEDITNPKYQEIDVLVGNDHAGLLLRNHEALNGLSRPENLVFKHSSIICHPVAVGWVYGQQNWTEAHLDITMKKEEVEIPKESQKDCGKDIKI